ncbi:MAG TPA: acetate/propionate family kinase [Fibrobacteria bacterium]|nr:acetate/propionate family kinase [Fibrobacteria bacterium]
MNPKDPFPGKTLLLANIGSSSRRYAMFSSGRIVAGAHMERTGGEFKLTFSSLTEETRSISPDEFSRGPVLFLDQLEAGAHFNPVTEVRAIGLRIVAPGTYFQENRIIDPWFLEALEKAEGVAPLHIASVLREIRILRERFPGIPMAGISDSAFHCTLPPSARGYAIPFEDAARLDLFRFGFHGISAQSALRHLGDDSETLPRRIILCHLGGGASVTAIRDGKSIDTSMGFSPLEGLIMGSRIGDIDPGAVLYLQKHSGMDADRLEEYFNARCGLLGLSGISPDIRELSNLEMEGDERARLALESFVYRIRKYIGAYLAALGGLDLLVFTGGIGEGSPLIRARVCEEMEWIGLALDPSLNQASVAKDRAIQAPDSKIQVKIIHARELAEMAALTESLLCR